MKFVDEAKITLVAGNGGTGIISFRREKFIPLGGPNGGDGGSGGSISMLACSETNTLSVFRLKSKYRAKNGGSGGSSFKTGANADDLILKCPVGTLIKTEDGILLADLCEEGSSYILAKGGEGGRGNGSFKTSTNRSPRICSPGEEGQSIIALLELRVLAEVGLLGLPNSGKSTILASFSSAKPKIADYPFTTLNPKLGVVNINEYCSFVMADIPGLIKGAARGLGLGHRFLRHLLRTKLLMHIVDASKDNIEDICLEIKQIEEEIKEYSEDLFVKFRWLVFNKIDLIDSKRIEELNNIFGSRYKIFAISAKTTEGCDQLKLEIYKYLCELKLTEKPRSIISEKLDKLDAILSEY